MNSTRKRAAPVARRYTAKIVPAERHHDAERTDRQPSDLEQDGKHAAVDYVPPPAPVHADAAGALPARGSAAIRGVLIRPQLLGLFLLLLGGGLGLPIPEDLTLLGAGVLANRHILRLRDVIAVGFGGVVAADWIIYLAGRRYGPSIVAHPWLARLFGASRMDAVRHAVERHGARAVFFARFMFGFRMATFLAAGTFGVSAPRFAVAEAAGAAIFVPAMTTLGFLFSDRALRAAHNVSRVQHWLVLLGLLGLTGYLALRAWVGRTGLGGEADATAKKSARAPEEARRSGGSAS